MTQLAEWFRLMAAAQILVFIALLVRDHRRHASARATAAFLVGVLAYLVLPLLFAYHVHVPLVVHPALILSGTVPFTFWLLAKLHFEDQPRITWKHWVLLVGLVAANYLMYISYDSGDLKTRLVEVISFPVMRFSARILGAGLVLQAFYRVYQGLGTELDESRLRLRYVFLGTSGVCILAVIVGEAIFMSESTEVPEVAALLIAAAILLLSTSYSFAFGGLNDRILRPPSVDPTPTDPELRRRFERLMEKQIYREPGLTIRQMAERLGDYEHKVRRHINAELGFRNFNAFLNHFRIQDARITLESSTESERNIADVAFELGYQSLGPFNKAFREATGLTPSEYRRKHLP